MNLIRIKAFPGSKKPSLEETAPQVVRVFVRETAERNMANEAVLKAVAEFYSIPRNKLRMISGHRGLNKIVQILE
jgi:uncharacterized protein YggU (UPF0235/DUF167 family)